MPHGGLPFGVRAGRANPVCSYAAAYILPTSGSGSSSASTTRDLLERSPRRIVFPQAIPTSVGRQPLGWLNAALVIEAKAQTNRQRGTSEFAKLVGGLKTERINEARRIQKNIEPHGEQVAHVRLPCSSSTTRIPSSWRGARSSIGKYRGITSPVMPDGDPLGHEFSLKNHVEHRISPCRIVRGKARQVSPSG